MSESGQAAFEFLRRASYRFFFCLGLSTASYYSFDQIKIWFGYSDETVHTVASSGLQDKVDVLMNNLAKQPLQVINESAPAPQPTRMIMQAQRAPSLPKMQPTAVVAFATPVPEASPSPSPNPPEATAEVPKDGEAAKEGEVAKVDVDAIPVAPIPMMPTQMEQLSQSAPSGDAPEQNSKDPNTLPQTFPSGGVPTAASLSNANPVFYPHNDPAVTTPAPLTAADLGLLSSTVAKASFVDKSENVTGLLCAVGATPGEVTGCSKTTNYSIHTSRWSDSEGLSSDAGFALRTVTGSKIQVDVSVKIQTLQQTFQTLSASVVPTQIVARNETRNGKHYRVFEMKLPDVTLKTDEVLSQVVATLSYDMSSTSQGSLSSDSTLNFVRTNRHTTNTSWDLSGTNRAPATSDQILVADQITYSMSLAKAP